MFIDSVEKNGLFLSLLFLFEAVFSEKSFSEILVEKDDFDLSKRFEKTEEIKSKIKTFPDVFPLVTENKDVNEINLKIYTEIYTKEELEVMWYEWNKHLEEMNKNHPQNLDLNRFL